MDFWAYKCPFLRPKNGIDKVLPFLGFFRSSIFVTARFLRTILGSELRELYWMCFRWFRVCVFVWIYSSDSGSSFVLPLLGLRGRCFGFRFPSSLFFLLRLPPFSSWGRLGFSSLPPSCVLAGPQRLGGRQVRAAHDAWHVFLSSSLCPGRLLSPFPGLSLSLSLSLSLFACLKETGRQ